MGEALAALFATGAGASVPLTAAEMGTMGTSALLGSLATNAGLSSAMASIPLTGAEIGTSGLLGSYGSMPGMAAGPLAGLPWQKAAKMAGLGMLQGQQQPPQAAPSAPPPTGPAAPISLGPPQMPMPGQPLGGAQAMMARLQGIDPMLAMRLQSRGF